MALSTGEVSTQPLSLPEELILMLLNEDNGYFHQMPGWSLNCALIGAVLAELSLMNRIDSDERSLFLLDKTETGNSALDPSLQEIADQPTQHDIRYWIERLTPHADAITDWTLSRSAWRAEATGSMGASGESSVQFVRARINKAIFDNEVPDPRDAIIISLVNTCDVFRFMFELDEEIEARIQFLCNIDLIGRSIAAAVEQNIAAPFFEAFRVYQGNPECLYP